MLSTRPRMSLPNAMLLAALTRVPVASGVMAEPRISVVMPRRSLSRRLPPPSSSVTTALLSSKRTPLTMTEPKPVIGPLAYDAGVVPVPPLSTPPPQPATIKASHNARNQCRVG